MNVLCRPLCGIGATSALLRRLPTAIRTASNNSNNNNSNRQKFPAIGGKRPRELDMDAAAAATLLADGGPAGKRLVTSMAACEPHLLMQHLGTWLRAHSASSGNGPAKKGNGNASLGLPVARTTEATSAEGAVDAAHAANAARSSDRAGAVPPPVTTAGQPPPPASSGPLPLTLYCANPNEPYDVFTDPELAGHVRAVALFLTQAVRKHQGPILTHLPRHLSAWARTLQLQGGIDVFWGSCTPPDVHGFVSLGPGLVYEADAMRAARHVVLEVNPALPLCHGAARVPVSEVDILVHAPPTAPLALEEPTFTDVDRQVAQHVAALVPDGATVQFGIGGIPNALGEALANHRNLGIHTEMVNNAMLQLIEAGAVTGRRKTRFPWQVVGAFALGTPDLYRFIHDNPGINFQPGALVNDALELGRNALMTSINTCVELDLTGQICSESIGHRELSGVGGATDTHIGAQRSEGGRGIIALRSTTADGESKIVTELKPGAKVSISRNDVDTVVTEYGVAELAPLSAAERVHALVRIAHPDHRERLEREARELRYI